MPTPAPATPPAEYGGSGDISSGQRSDPGYYVPPPTSTVPGRAIGQSAYYAPPPTSSAPRSYATNVQAGAPGFLSQAATPGEIETFIEQQALARGIDPEIAKEIARREGGTDKREGNEGVFPTGKSYWAYQLHYGGAGTPYAGWGGAKGMGNDFTAATGIQPGDPNGWQQAITYALDHARRYGWGAWYGRQANQGRGLREIGEWEGIPQRGQIPR